MLIRREDFGDINKLTKGSSKKIWFICDWCGVGTLRSYKNYLKTDKDLCIICQKKEVASRPEVKLKQSKSIKKRWKDSDYREMMSLKLSEGCKKAWDNDDGSRRKFLSENNPMKREEIKEKFSKESSTSIENLKMFLKSIDYEYISRERRKRGGTIIHFKCDKGHIDSRRLDAMLHGARCSYCSPGGSSKGERELQKFIYNLLGEECKFNVKKKLYPLELDILIPNKNIAIEYNGLHWHSEYRGKDKWYHLNKLNQCNQKGIRLIQIFEDEWMNKKDIVKKRLEHILNFSSNSIYARKCEISQISTKEARKFCELHHIQGYGNSSIKIGLIYKDNLVSLMTFSKPSVSKGSKSNDGNCWELNRYCTSCNVVGGFSKLLSHFKNNYEWNKIYSYVDKRWNTGKTYKKLGFYYIGDTKPNYWYGKMIKGEPVRYHRFNFRRDQLEGEGTEKEIMIRNGWNIIWDCGSMKYEINKR